MTQAETPRFRATLGRALQQIGSKVAGPAREAAAPRLAPSLAKDDPAGPVGRPTTGPSIPGRPPVLEVPRVPQVPQLPSTPEAPSLPDAPRLQRPRQALAVAALEARAASARSRRTAPVTSTTATVRQRSSALTYGVSPVHAVVPSHLIPGRRDIDPWWTDELPERDEDGPPDRGQIVTGRDTYPLVTLDGRRIQLHRTVTLSADGRRRKRFELLDERGARPSPPIAREDLPLYRVEEVTADSGTVIVAEGAPATDALRGWGFTAAGTLTGAIGTPTLTALAPLMAAGRIVLWPDNDEVGVRHMERIARLLHGAGAADLSVVRWEGGPFHGDAANVAGQKAAQALLDAAVGWRPGRVLLADEPRPPSARVRVPLKLELSDEDRPPMPRLVPEADAPRPARDHQLVSGPSTNGSRKDRR